MTVTDSQATAGGTGIVAIDTVSGGIAFVPQSTPLIRLNYFDGKFLRADDLNLEQRGQRELVHLSNQAGGPGIVYGLDVTVAAGTKLALAAGLGIDPAGRVLYLPEPVEVPIADLLAAAQGTSPAPGGGDGDGDGEAAVFAPCEAELVAGGSNVVVVEGTQLYLVALAHAEALCGSEEVLGRLCQQGCETAEDRPYRNEGVVLLLLPLPLAGRLAPASGGITFTDTHLRSRVASAWFGQERATAGSWLSAPLLRSTAWCQGALATGGVVVPVGVLGWKASAVVFFDPWTVRRERMEAPARAYWAGRMELRPWPVFLAQVLQFQCQYAGLPTAPGGGGPGDPCAPSKDLLGVSARLVDSLAAELQQLGWTGSDVGGFTFDAGALAAFKQRTVDVLATPPAAASGSTLIDGGIVELPPAGYLPVDPQSPLPLRAQLEPMFGSGVDLRFCAVRRDQVPHELERAQHMDRISLLQGRIDPDAVERVDILVPDGVTTEVTGTTNPWGFAVDLAVALGGRRPSEGPGVPTRFGTLRAAAAVNERQVPLRGVGRLVPDGVGVSGHVAAAGVGEGLRSLLRLVGTLTPDATSSLDRSGRIRAAGRDVSPTDLRRWATLLTDEVVAARRTADRTGRVVSLAAGVDGDAVAMWSSCWTGGDPFTVAKGASFPFSLGLDAFVPGDPSSLLKVALTGQAVVVSRRVATESQTVELRVTGVVSGDSVNLRDVHDLSRAVVVDVQLRREERAGQTIMQLATGKGGDTWRASMAFAGTPVVANAVLSEGDLAGRRLAEGQALQDGDVDRAGNEYHDLAVDALTILQGAKPDDPLFLDDSLRALFPTGGTTTSVEVGPTTDWVLFRRRRWEECEGVVAAPPAAAANVATFVAVAEDEDKARAMAEALFAGNGDQVAWTPVDVVEFTAGTSDLLTLPAVVRQAYLAAGGGPRLTFVGYGANRAGDPTGIGRARALAEALEPAAALDDDNLELVLDPPVGEVVPGTEATVFYVSYREAPGEVDCVEVFNIEDVDTREGHELRKAIEAGDVGALAGAPVDPLGSVRFSATEPGPELDDIAAKFADLARQHEAEGRPRFPVGVGWIAADLDDDQSAAKDVQLTLLADKFQLLKLNSFEVAFDHVRRCSARLFVLQALDRPPDG